MGMLVSKKNAKNNHTAAAVSAEWLKDHISNSSAKLVILDVTWYPDKDAQDSYNEKHIPGARFLNVFKGAVHTPTHSHNLPPNEVFQREARNLGINNDDHIIVYDSIPGKFGLFLGGRAWWMFRLYGHTNVSVLDGGLDKWLELGYPTTQETSSSEPGNFTIKYNSALIRDFDQMTEVAKKQNVQLMDARPDGMYRGQLNDPKSGHMIGAVNAPFPKAYVDLSTKTLKSPEQLRRAFNYLKINPERPIIGMCIGGMSSTSIALTSYMLGNKTVAIYLGSFTEWGQRAPEDLIEQLEGAGVENQTSDCQNLPK